MVNWTAEQSEAIRARDGNLLVAAAAGSGKTAVLVERIIRRVCDEQDPIDVDRLLVVTFTNAAAQEMRERVGQAIREKLRKNPLSKNLYRQSTLLNKASILTLHSFCLEVVKENFYTLGIDPNFRIADDIEAQLLKMDVLEELLEKYYQNSAEDSGFIKLVDAYGGQRDDRPIEDLIIQIHQFAGSNPWPEFWLEETLEKFTRHNWFDEILPSILIDLKGAEQLLVQAYKYTNKPGGPLAYQANLENELKMFRDLIAAAKVSWDKLYQAIRQSEFNNLPRIKKGSVQEYWQKRVQELRNKAKDILKAIENKYFSRAPAELINDLHFLEPYLEVLVCLIKDFQQGFQEKKTKKLLVDFNDLEHFCLQILLAKDAKPNEVLPSEVCLKLRKRFLEVLVDEYQDINDVQETILTLVSSGNNLFMVGDVKQSIYRFRLAKPELFLTKYHSFDLDKKALNRRIDLARNFRCERAIVDGVNFLFRQIMTPVVGEMAYDQKAELIYRGEGSANPEETIQDPLEFYLLENKSDLVADELANYEREAEIIGQRILELIATEATIMDQTLKEEREINFKDIVILLRSPKGMAEIFLERFNYLGIPVYAELGSGYFEALEVQTILSLLKIIDNPRQDIPLAAILRSPILGLGADELAEIKLNAPLESFVQAVLKTSVMENDLAKKLQEFLQNLARWRTIARQGNLADLIWILYRETGYFDYVGALPGGLQRQANLRALHDRARQYEATSFRGLFRFLRFIERIGENKGDLDTAKALSENENVVRILSIHKSKGLEFPVVFVAGLGRKFNFVDSRQNIVIHKDLGLGPVLIDSEQRIKYPTIAKMAIEKRILLETLAEEMRILYVALTRAREKLILIASARDLSKKIEGWSNILEYTGLSLPEYQLISAQSFLDWLGLALIRHQDALDLRSAIAQESQGFNLFNDHSLWKINLLLKGLVSEKTIPVENEIKPKDIEDLKPLLLEHKYQKEIDQKLNWQYPHHYLLNKSAKLSVSEIKHIFHSLPEEEYSPRLGFSKRPAFKQKQKGLSASEKGSAIHFILEQIELGKNINHQYLKELFLALEKKELLTAEETSAVNKDLIIDFFQSPLGQRLQKAIFVRRELPFSLVLPAAEIYQLPEEETEEKVLVQGIIDCLWQEEDGWILLDYKSDQVREEELESITRKYTGQINLYSRAIENILKAPVKEKYIYFLNIGKSVAIV